MDGLQNEAYPGREREGREKRDSVHLSELGLGRELLDGLDEVLVGISIRSEDLTEERNHREGVLSVDAEGAEETAEKGDQRREEVRRRRREEERGRTWRREGW